MCFLYVTAYDKNANLIACESEGRKTVTLARRCLYDVDNAGHVIGCRWLSHLANCGKKQIIVFVFLILCLNYIYVTIQY